MHELGLVYQVVKTVDEVVKKNGLAEVDEIVLQVGEMSDVVPKFLEEAWVAAALTTDYPSAKMTVEVMPALAKCLSCVMRDMLKLLLPIVRIVTRQISKLLRVDSLILKKLSQNSRKIKGCPEGILFDFL